MNDDAPGRFTLEPAVRAEAAAEGRRFALLAEVGRELSSSLEPREMLTRLADRTKDEFLAMLAHELRNPLAAISNAGHALDRKGGADPRSSELLAVIGRQIRPPLAAGRRPARRLPLQPRPHRAAPRCRGRRRDRPAADRAAPAHPRDRAAGGAALAGGRPDPDRADPRQSPSQRGQPGLDGLRLIALTGYGQEADRRRASLAGFDHHLVKPVDMEQLRGLLAAEGSWSE